MDRTGIFGQKMPESFVPSEDENNAFGQRRRKRSGTHQFT
jgi:hypothetical protein